MRIRRPTCEFDVPEESVAALAHAEIVLEEERAALWEHLEGCAECADLYVSHVRIRGFARDHVARTRRRGRLFRVRPRVAAAAVLLVLLSAAAVAGILTATRTVFIGSTDWTDVASWAAIGYEFDELGVTGGQVVGRHPFTLETEEPGHLFLIQTPGNVGLLLCAFDGRGGALWGARRDWTDYPSTLGLTGLTTPGAKRLPLAVRDGRIEERILVFAQQGRRSGAFLIDPRSGQREWDLYYDGVLNGTATVMREESDGRRPVILGGARGTGLHAEPVFLVVAPDGEVRQQVALPVVDRGRARDVAVRGVFSSWRAAPMRLEVHVPPGMNFTLEWTGRELDLDRVEAFPVDHLEGLMIIRYTADVWDEMKAQFGEAEDWLKGVAGAVSPRDDPIPTKWRDQ